MDLTTSARVKNYLPVGSSTQLDALIALVITSVSNEFEEFLSRYLLSTTYTETIRLDRFKRIIALRGVPVTSITSLKYTADGDFASATATQTTLYASNLTLGTIELLFEQRYDPAFVQVVYVGGMAATTAAFIAAFPRIADACDQQVAYQIQRRDKQGGNMQVGAGSTQYTGQLALLDSVKDALSLWKRRYA